MAWFGQGSKALSIALLTAFATHSARALAQSSLNPVPESGSTTQEPSWHPSAALTFTGGALFVPSSEEAKWKKRQPMHFQVGQTFKVAEPAGELGLGAAITYDAAGGSAERTVGGEKEAVDLSLYAFGLVAAADWRLAVTPSPVIAPRISVFGGVAMQNQKTLQTDFTTKNEQYYKPIAGARAHVELSLMALNPSERGAVAYGYGVEDFVFMAGTTYLMDLNPRKSHKIGGYTLEGGLGFLLP